MVIPPLPNRLIFVSLNHWCNTVVASLQCFYFCLMFTVQSHKRQNTHRLNNYNNNIDKSYVNNEHNKIVKTGCVWVAFPLYATPFVNLVSNTLKCNNFGSYFLYCCSPFHLENKVSPNLMFTLRNWWMHGKKKMFLLTVEVHMVNLLSLIHFTQIIILTEINTDGKVYFEFGGEGLTCECWRCQHLRGSGGVILPKTILKSWSLEILLSLFYFLLFAWNLCPWNNRPFYNLWMTLLWLETSLLLFFKFLLIIWLA